MAGFFALLCWRARSPAIKANLFLSKQRLWVVVLSSLVFGCLVLLLHTYALAVMLQTPADLTDLSSLLSLDATNSVRNSLILIDLALMFLGISLLLWSAASGTEKSDPGGGSPGAPETWPPSCFPAEAPDNPRA